jgi:AcrR family transcriptional regulator
MASADPSPRVTRPSADATRGRILAAALELFADRSFDGASTRDIAERAGVSQPSLGYHFRSKDELWRAAVSSLFAELEERMGARLHGLRGVDDVTRAELLVRDFIAFSAEHPQLHRIITQESKVDGDRMDWLVDQHVRPLYELTTGMFERLVAQGAVPDVPAPFLYYILTGAGPTIFVLAPECRRLAGFDPMAPDAVETHADIVVDLLFGRSRADTRPSR